MSTELPLLVATNRSPRRGGGFSGSAATTLSHLVGNQRVSQVEFRRTLFSRLSSGAGPEDPPSIVILLHGFNVAWEQALETFALWHAAFAGPNVVPVGFSWPAEGEATHYLDDRGAARASAEPLARSILDAVRLLQAAKCAARLVVVAHSMGNYLLAKACEVAWEMSGRPTDLNVLAEVLMVAPDLDGDVFAPGGMALPVASLSRRVTVYFSRHDRALLASSAKRAGVTGARLGRQGAGGPRPGNVVTVDATARVTPDSPGGSHSGHFQDATVLGDMRQVIAGVDRGQVAGRVVAEGFAAYSLT